MKARNNKKSSSPGKAKKSRDPSVHEPPFDKSLGQENWVEQFIAEAFDTPNIDQSTLTKHQCISAIQEVLFSHKIVDINQAETIYRDQVLKVNKNQNKFPVSEITKQLMALSKQLHFQKAENHNLEHHIAKEDEIRIEQQVQQIIGNIVEKGHVKRLTKVAMADSAKNFNDAAFEKDYKQLTSLNQL